ncbi:VCBS repeat-containing protein [Desulfuromonas sp. CSMB_57]|uniref:FG-GAP repeat domain-containing protein n=1 Tax=Desulfuromonas sp. CSMB_57 TaxID=2807629 RepID=UPI001CD3B0BD|nr:VCBS repeat-containing protein [Desulfuromonas sp. CSMB_57]
MSTRVSIVIAVLLVLVTGTVQAGTLEEIVQDLQPVPGYVVLPVQDEFLIDLAASHGVTNGDLFSVVAPGEPITHPVTGKLLGTLDGSKGLLQVTQVKSGFSHARPLGQPGAIVRGDAIRRYDGLRATFWDYTGQGEEFYGRLKAALPALRWQSYGPAQAEKPGQAGAVGKTASDLVVVLTARNLTVRDASGSVIRSYPAPPLAAVPSAMAPVPVAAPVVAAPAPVAPAAAPYRLEQPPAPGSVRYEAAFPGFQVLGNPGFAVVMADFVRENSELLMAATDGARIKIQKIYGGINTLTEVEVAGLPQVVGLHWWQPQAGLVYLAVSAWKDTQMASALYRFENNRLLPISENLSHLFGSFDRDGDGRRETLLAQNMDRELFWGTVVRQVSVQGNRISLNTPSFELPRRFTVGGSTMVDLTGNGKPETVVVRDGLLYIYAGSKEIYRSAKLMGGSLARFPYQVHPQAYYTPTNFAVVEVPPVAADLDGDGRPELLVVASDSGMFSAPGLSANVRKSWLAVLKYRDNTFVKGNLGEEMSNPLQGLTVQDQRVLFVATEPGSVFGKGGESQILVFSLAH